VNLRVKLQRPTQKGLRRRAPQQHLAAA